MTHPRLQRRRERWEPGNYVAVYVGVDTPPRREKVTRTSFTKGGRFRVHVSNMDRVFDVSGLPFYAKKNRRYPRIEPWTDKHFKRAGELRDRELVMRLSSVIHESSNSCSAEKLPHLVDLLKRAVKVLKA